MNSASPAGTFERQANTGKPHREDLTAADSSFHGQDNQAVIRVSLS